MTNQRALLCQTKPVQQSIQEITNVSLCFGPISQGEMLHRSHRRQKAFLQVYGLIRISGGTTRVTLVHTDKQQGEESNKGGGRNYCTNLVDYRLYTKNRPIESETTPLDSWLMDKRPTSTKPKGTGPSTKEILHTLQFLLIKPIFLHENHTLPVSNGPETM